MHRLGRFEPLCDDAAPGSELVDDATADAADGADVDVEQSAKERRQAAASTMAAFVSATAALNHRYTGGGGLGRADECRVTLCRQADSIGTALTDGTCSSGKVGFKLRRAIVLATHAGADAFAMIVFHVTTLMPNAVGDARCTAKVRRLCARCVF